jgi:hypothetical protein
MKSYDVVYVWKRNFEENPDLMSVWSCDLYKYGQIDQTLSKHMLYTNYGPFFEANSTMMVTEGGNVTCDWPNKDKWPNMVIDHVIYHFEAFFETKSAIIVTGDDDVICDGANTNK